MAQLITGPVWAARNWSADEGEGTRAVRSNGAANDGVGSGVDRAAEGERGLRAHTVRAQPPRELRQADAAVAVLVDGWAHATIPPELLLAAVVPVDLDVVAVAGDVFPAAVLVDDRVRVAIAISRHHRVVVQRHGRARASHSPRLPHGVRPAVRRRADVTWDAVYQSSLSS